MHTLPKTILHAPSSISLFPLCSARVHSLPNAYQSFTTMSFCYYTHRPNIKFLFLFSCPLSVYFLCFWYFWARKLEYIFWRGWIFHLPLVVIIHSRLLFICFIKIFFPEILNSFSICELNWGQVHELLFLKICLKNTMLKSFDIHTPSHPKMHQSKELDCI